MLGRPGKNMSIDNGPIAVSAPKMMINNRELRCLGCDCSKVKPPLYL